MDNFDLINFKENEDDGFPPPDPELDKPIPFDDSDSAPKPVSRKPLSMGAGAGEKQPTPPERAVAPVAPVKPVKPAQRPAANTGERPAANTGDRPAARAATSAVVPGERISGLKTFFTKLHPGALVYLDEQVTEWLKANPDIQIKRTNSSVGDVMSKKTEPNLILSVWY